MKLIVIKRSTNWCSIICPNCKKELEIFENKSTFDSNSCPYCGIDLERENKDEK